MRICYLQAEAFRNLRIPRAELSPGINILYGDNAQGKTNFLEAVYFCALGRALRADNSRELIPIGGAETAHARAEFLTQNREAIVPYLAQNHEAIVPYDEQNHEAIEPYASPPSSFTVDAKITQHGGKCMKSISIDRVPIKNTRELFGKVPIVSFAPEDLRLVKAGPAERRRFMDIGICQFSPVYYGELRVYHRALRQRNHLLKIVQKDRTQAEALSVWDAQLVEHGVRILRIRLTFIEKISALAGAIHKEITRNKESLLLEYRPGIADAQSFTAALERNRKRDILQGTTSTGIHRDDIQFTVRGISARTFGSQGQTRTAVLSVKLAEIVLLRERMGKTPILLLDDVFSELDANRAGFLLEQVKDVQTLLTCTGIEGVLEKINGDMRLLRVKEGKIEG